MRHLERRDKVPHGLDYPEGTAEVLHGLDYPAGTAEVPHGLDYLAGTAEGKELRIPSSLKG